MSSPSVGIKDILETAGVGDFGDNTPDTGRWTSRIGRLTDTPNRQIAIYDTGGQEPNPKWLLNNPTAMVSVRGEPDEYAETWTKARDVFDALVGYESADLNGDRWVGIWAMGDINFLGYDEERRPEFTVNLRLIIEPAASSLTHREAL